MNVAPGANNATDDTILVLGTVNREDKIETTTINAIALMLMQLNI